MSIEVVWRATDTNLTHRAVILGDDMSMQEVRTVCGLSLSVMTGEAVEADTAIGCSVCSHQETKATSQHPHRDNGRKHCRKVTSLPVKADAPLPYGIFHVDPRLAIDRGPPERVKCCVRGCKQFLIPPSRWRQGEMCPEHSIRTHSSGTYSYPDPKRNTIIAPDLLSRIIRQPFKFESGRFGYERGEDMLSFNVFRAFQEAKGLHLITRLITGQDVETEPHLFLWGLELTDDSLRPWDLLIAARQRFETSLPVKRPATEPDIAIYEPGQFLILCEAKFCSENPVYRPGPRKDKQSLTLEELIKIYDDPALRIIDREKAHRMECIPYQLYRNMQFADYMAYLDSPRTIPFLANLTRQGSENASFEQFFRLIRPEYANRAVHLFWEQLFTIAGLSGGRLRRLQQYMLTKTANLKPAFSLGYW